MNNTEKQILSIIHDYLFDKKDSVLDDLTYNAEDPDMDDEDYVFFKGLEKKFNVEFSGVYYEESIGALMIELNDLVIYRDDWDKDYYKGIYFTKNSIDFN